MYVKVPIKNIYIMWDNILYYIYRNDDEGNNLIVNGLRMTEEPEVRQGRCSVLAKLFNVYMVNITSNPL